jgi:hypothetical protein
MGYMDTMALSNISRTPLVKLNNKKKYSSLNLETSPTIGVITANTPQKHGFR